MIFKRLNRTSPEQVFAVFQASEAGIAADDVVMIDTSSNDGVAVEQPTGLLGLVVGVVDAAIANGAYGLVQIYGYRSTSRVNFTGASVTPGVALAPQADSDNLIAGATVPAAYLPAFAAIDSLASSGTTGTASIKIFIRCM